ncbi:LysR family transcriptional regulator [Azospirillum agricola]|uniref:LysR family transcriptional regulator n=1 Tax=Azospirillum agricola TaxID=1720247 RepID=UPI000A0F2924|nr:LysR family transcriptional regulator [Azospirillum agricola]SMH62736.1 DNA-binding transcriptional regulator, LysR family [Azospirillum lipoferum]
MDLSLRQIRAFLAVAQTHSFTRAADLLHVAQPTLTVQIRRLEEALDVKLFDRNTRTVNLTRVGRELLPVFQRMVHDLDAVVVDTHEIAAKRRGIVRVAALPTVAAGVLPDAIRSFRERHPGASFVLKDVIAGRVLALVRSEEVDLGVMGGEVKGQDIETLLEASDRLHVVFPKDHPVAGLPRVTIATLADLPLVLMDPATSVREIVDEAFLNAGLIAKPVCEATYMMTAVAMVRAGLGLTILPGSAREIGAEPGLRSRPIDSAGFSRSVRIIRKAGRTLPPLSEAFAEYLRAAFGPGSVVPHAPGGVRREDGPWPVG